MERTNIKLLFIKNVIFAMNYKFKENEFIKFNLNPVNYKLALEKFIILVEIGDNYKLPNSPVTPLLLVPKKI